MLRLCMTAITPIKRSCYQTNYIITLWWYRSLWSFKGNNIMKQNCSITISRWWVSHLSLIKNSNIHFWGTSCLVCLTSLPTSGILSVLLSLLQKKSLSIIYRAPFNNCISLTDNLLIRISAALIFLEITVIRKSKHPPGLSFIGSVFRAVYCLLQLAPKTWRLVARPWLYCMLTDNSLWGRNTAATRRQWKRQTKEMSYEKQHVFPVLWGNNTANE